MTHRFIPLPERGLGRLLALALLALVSPLATQAQSVPNGDDVRRSITPEDYARFESLGQASFSADARFLAVTVSRVDDDGEVRLVPLDGGEERVFELATGHSMAPAGSWMGVVTGPPQEERRRMQRENTPIRNDLILLNTETGEESTIERVQGHSFSDDGRFVLLNRYAPEGGNRDSSGRDVVVRELDTGIDVNFGNVAQASWADDRAVLGMVIDAADMAGNGVRVYDAETGAIRTLHTDAARFSNLTWRDESLDLAVFRRDLHEDRGDTLYTVLAWRDGLQGDRTPLQLDGAVPASVAGNSGGEELGIRTLRGIDWSDDGTRIFVGVQPRDPADEVPDEEEADDEGAVEDEIEPSEEDEDEEGPRRPASSGADSVPGLEIWHARDIDPVPQQRVRANIERNRSHLLAWTLGADPVLLGGGGAGESISRLDHRGGAILQDDTPYGQERMFGPVYRDVYLVDGDTGDRTLLEERLEFFSGTSPEDQWALFFRDDHWHSIELATGEVRSITHDLPAVFTNQERDVVVPQQPPYGIGGWLDDDQHVLLYDRYDIWRVAADGSGGERYTQGAEDEVRHRIVRLDWDEPALPAAGPHWVSLYGEWTKQSGYGRIEGPGQVERLVWEDRMVSRLSKADEAESYFYMSQRYDDPPSFHLVDADLSNPRRIVRSNAFIDEFRIGRSELVEYENDWGEPLQGALYYPADYEPGREYPMIVYHYERLSQGLHGWTNPSDRSAYNTRVFTQNGYFVLQPDIIYRPRNPGLSAMEAILPAVDAAVATGMIDESAIGITGHSWGGYQTTFAVTQTDRFAAAIAGAPLTNLMSMYLSFYWNTGSTDARIFEISQGRMEVPWWEDFESYRLNSPVHHIESMNTPLLMAFGDEDGAVEFNQGVEFYNAARRAGKDFVLLVYEGENHSLSQRPNQEDYHRRSLEWFNHYLKGAEAPAWITEGVSYLDQQEKLRRGPAAGRR